ncbi:MAG TPA: hypothetical protein IAA49_02175 [Candidatus Alistipes pullicola]|nr:hypothetical protein [Candidatus Alistipes pullicola]
MEEALFQVQAHSSDPACEQTNLHLSIASYNSEGTLLKVDYTDATPIQRNKVYAVETTVHAASVAVSLYAVPQTDPLSDLVADNPDFTVTYEIFKNGKKIDTKKLSINRWGGAQTIGLHYE